MSNIVDITNQSKQIIKEFTNIEIEVIREALIEYKINIRRGVVKNDRDHGIDMVIIDDIFDKI